jgi:hypothetical protein
MIVKLLHSDGLEEMSIVEFQGEIIGDSVGEMGTLEVKGGKVDMTLGQHTLVGKVVDLKSPFLVVEKVTNEQSSVMSCCGVVKKKILFSNRPQPIRMVKKK